MVVSVYNFVVNDIIKYDIVKIIFLVDKDIDC